MLGVARAETDREGVTVTDTVRVALPDGLGDALLVVVPERVRDTVGDTEGDAVRVALPDGLAAVLPERDAVPVVGPLGLSWGAVENSGKDLFRVTNWDERDGPLSNTDNGTALPLARLEVSRRQLAHIAGETSHVYATFADGQPFLTGQRIGAGTLLACATLPEADWSTTIAPS
jgi:hypothetical protein